MCLFDPYATFEVSIAVKSLPLLPFLCCFHSAAAACKACEHAHRARWQDGATGLCQRPCCWKRAGSCYFLCCSRCRFEFSCRHNRSDADMNTCYSLLQASSIADRCSPDLCMRLCRKIHRRLPSGLVRQAAVRVVPTTPCGARTASSLWSWQGTRHMHHSSEPTRSHHPHARRTREASLRHSAVDAAVEAKEGSACSSGRSAAASWLPRGSSASAAAHGARRASASDDCRARAHPHRSFAADPLRADDHRM